MRTERLRVCGLSVATVMAKGGTFDIEGNREGFRRTLYYRGIGVGAGSLRISRHLKKERG